MLADPGSSYALFAVVWGAMCLVASALVTALAVEGAAGEACTEAQRRTF